MCKETQICVLSSLVVFNLPANEAKLQKIFDITTKIIDKKLLFSDLKAKEELNLCFIENFELLRQMESKINLKQFQK